MLKGYLGHRRVRWGGFKGIPSHACQLEVFSSPSIIKQEGGSSAPQSSGLVWSIVHFSCVGPVQVARTARYQRHVVWCWNVVCSEETRALCFTETGNVCFHLCSWFFNWVCLNLKSMWLERHVNCTLGILDVIIVLFNYIFLFFPFPWFDLVT